MQLWKHIMYSTNRYVRFTNLIMRFISCRVMFPSFSHVWSYCKLSDEALRAYSELYQQRGAFCNLNIWWYVSCKVLSPRFDPEYFHLFLKTQVSGRYLSHMNVFLFFMFSHLSLLLITTQELCNKVGILFDEWSKLGVLANSLFTLKRCKKLVEWLQH